MHVYYIRYVVNNAEVVNNTPVQPRPGRRLYTLQASYMLTHMRAY